MSAFKSIRLFERPWMEACTHVHPAVPGLLWGPIVVWLGWRGVVAAEATGFEIASCAVLSLVAWTFVEYMMHRYLFHLRPRTALGQRLIYLFHGIHHDQPQDPTRLVMPPVVSLALGIAFYALFRSLLGVWTDLSFAFFVCGYLAYDYIHYSVHHFRPRTWVGRYLKQHHMLHHFTAHESRWGVSSPLWDWALGTLREEGEGKAQGTGAG